MEENIRPTPDGVYRRRLPGLKPVPTVEVMQRLPEVEDCKTCRGIAQCKFGVANTPSSQSWMFVYIAPATRTRRNILSATEKLGHQGAF